MKRFLSKSLLGITLLASASLASCSCKKYTDLEPETGAEKEETKKEETVVEIETEESEESEESTTPEVNPEIYSAQTAYNAYLYGQVGQRKQLTPIFDGNSVDPSLCNWASDHSNYISVNNQGIVEANTNLDFVKEKQAEIQSEISQKISNGEIVFANLTQKERDLLTYQISTDSIVTATLKSDKSKICAFKVGGKFDKFKTKNADQGKEEAVIHTVTYGQDSTVTFDLETEPVGKLTTLNAQNEEVYVDVYKTHIIYIENHLDPKEDLLSNTDAAKHIDSNPNPITMESHNGYETSSVNASFYADCDIIKLVDCPTKRTFTIEVENALYHYGQVNPFERLGTTFTITVNIV